MFDGLRPPRPFRLRLGLWAAGLAFLGAAASLLASGTLGAQTGPGRAVILTVDGPIGPATSDYLRRGLEEAAERDAQLVILRMDTPGGLSQSMRAIIQNILASDVPVATYVAPAGARAASAGTYILYASHVAAMAPGTNLGAATPVNIGGGGSPVSPGSGDGGGQGSEGDQGGGPGSDSKGEGGSNAGGSDGKPTVEDKALQDAIAYIRGLAQLRGRNADWAEKAVREAASLPAKTALEMNVVDLMASDNGELLEKIDGRTVTVNDTERRLETANLAIESIEPGWRTEILSIITNPNVAYILMMIGIYGLILEFYSPGAMVPGVVGGISLLLGLFALQLLPINYAGLALILLGMALMVGEAFAPSFGVLGLGGLAAFVLGSIMLIDTDVPAFELSLYVIIPVAVVTAGLFVLTVYLALRAWQRPVTAGGEAMLGEKGEVVEWYGGEGRVRVHGEIWHARGPAELQANSVVTVKARDKLKLEVEPANNS